MIIEQSKSTVFFREARAHVEVLLNSHLSEEFKFHSLSHTNDVIIACNLIATHEQLDSQLLDDLLIAACFHDTGFIKTYENHEEISIQLAEKFGMDHGMSRKRIDNVARLINVTRVHQIPEDLPEKIICDADYSHLSKCNYQEYLHLLRREWELVLNKRYTDKEWLSINMNFLISHKYHTEYAQENWNEMKSNNLGFIEKVARVIIPMDSV